MIYKICWLIISEKNLYFFFLSWWLNGNLNVSSRTLVCPWRSEIWWLQAVNMPHIPENDTSLPSIAIVLPYYYILLSFIVIHNNMLQVPVHDLVKNSNPPPTFDSQCSESCRATTPCNMGDIRSMMLRCSIKRFRLLSFKSEDQDQLWAVPKKNKIWDKMSLTFVFMFHCCGTWQASVLSSLQLFNWNAPTFFCSVLDSQKYRLNLLRRPWGLGKPRRHHKFLSQLPLSLRSTHFSIPHHPIEVIHGSFEGHIMRQEGG